MSTTLDYGVTLVSRAEWGARQPTSTSHLNASYGATRHWEGPHMGAFPHDSCAPKVRGIQDFHMDSKGWTDIAYTGVVCPHGYVYEGRGLFRRTAANGTNTGNETAYAFCYLGGEGDPYTEAGKRAMKAAMNWTRHAGGAGPNRNDHNDWKSTACPGAEIEAWGDGGEPIQLPLPPVEIEEDLMPFPVVAAPSDNQTTRPWRALLPGKVVTFTNVEPLPLDTPTESFAPSWAYDEGVAAGVFKEFERAGTDVQYDRRVAVAQQYTRLP